MKEVDDKKISIIVPAYNCEKYIQRCIESIISQSYKNLEIIIINDGSKDKTLDVINKLKEKDNRILIIDKENTGVSDTRNVGIKNATGEYIGFVDADDYLEKDMYLEMMKILRDSEADLCMVSYYEIVNNKKKEVRFPWNEKIKVFKNSEIYNSFFPLMVSKFKSEKNTIMGAVWRILIKANIAKTINFNTKLSIAEDLLYISDYLLKSKTIVTINKCFYDYVKNCNSATEKYKEDYDKTNEIFYTEFLERLNRMKFFNKKENQIRYGLNRFTMYTLSLSNIVKNQNISFLKKRKLVKNLLKKIKNERYINKNIVKELDKKRQLAYILILSNLYSLLILFFILKNKIKNKKIGE